MLSAIPEHRAIQFNYTAAEKARHEQELMGLVDFRKERVARIVFAVTAMLMVAGFAAIIILNRED